MMAVRRRRREVTGAGVRGVRVRSANSSIASSSGVISLAGMGGFLLVRRCYGQSLR